MIPQNMRMSYLQLPVKAACPQVQRADTILLRNDFRMFPGTSWKVNKCYAIGSYINIKNSLSFLNHREKHCDFQEQIQVLSSRMI